jgi:hypothetical protein
MYSVIQKELKILKKLHISKIYYSVTGDPWCRKLVQISRVKTWEKIRGSSKIWFTLDVKPIVME